jgi:transposase
MQSQRISEFLSKIGTEESHKNFFTNYIEFLKNFNPKFVTLIDSTGLKNCINISLTAINNHNGVISKEIRLISVIDRISEFPIYYRYVPGNIVDVSTLTMIINELKEYKININNAILDAGYFSEENINLLIENNIPFLTRMVPRRGLYEDLIKSYVPNIKENTNFVKFGERNLYIKKVPVQIFKSKMNVNAYICLDMEKLSSDIVKYYKKYDDKTTKEKLEFDTLKLGVFILVSTLDLDINDLLPLYYNRQSVEQIFDYIKNEIDIIPLRTHSQKTFSGHILISFLATVCFIALNKALKKNSYSVSSTINALEQLNCRVYPTRITPDVPNKIINDVLKTLKLKIPKIFPLDNKEIKYT